MSVSVTSAPGNLEKKEARLILTGSKAWRFTIVIQKDLILKRTKLVQA